MKEIILETNRKNRREFGRTKNNGITPKGTLKPIIKDKDIMKGLRGVQKERSQEITKRFKHLKNLGYGPSDNPRMFLYSWHEDDDTTKMGEHWVLPGIDPVEDTLKYIRKNMARRKDKFDDGTVQVSRIWDISEFAKSIDRFRPKSKVDDVIRKYIGYVKQSEVHSLNFILLNNKVQEFLDKQGQPPPIVNLSTDQYFSVYETVQAVKEGKRRLLGEKCARFGKTIYSSAVATEIGSEFIIVSSYVKTVHSSFETDINSFDQFKEYHHVNSQDEDYKEKIESLLKQGKKVVVYLSLVGGTSRDMRIQYLFNLPKQKFVVVDEADFGAHQKKQTEVLQKFVKKDDIVYLLTGTNSDRASSTWDIDHMNSKTYFELLVSRKESEEIIKKGIDPISNPLGLKHFSMDKTRDTLYPKVKGYQVDLISSVNKAIKLERLEDEDFKLLPSWTKFVSHPLKSKGWYITLLEAMFRGKHSLNDTNIDYQLEETTSRRIAMMFFPDNTRKEHLDVIGNITQQTLPEYEVVILNGNTTTQKKVEAKVKKVIEENPTKSILILSAKMAQRSFSIKQLDELYLCYDKGQNGATIQKMSRALTPNDDKKVGKIISLSFDPNRDDKFDALLVETALNLLKSNKKPSETDIREQLKRILDSIDIFSCTENGAIPINVDTFIESSLQRKTISRVMGNKTNIGDIPNNILVALAQGKIDYVKNQIQDKALVGKTKESEKNPTKGTRETKPATQVQIQKVREMLVTIYENSDILLKSAKHLGAKNMIDSFRVFEEQGWENDITKDFGVDYGIIKWLFISNKINSNWVNFLHG